MGMPMCEPPLGKPGLAVQLTAQQLRAQALAELQQRIAVQRELEAALEQQKRQTDQAAHALAEAEAATALPRHWPAWAALIFTLGALLSHIWPWGFAPGV